MKYHLVNWNAVSGSLKCGGLGIRKIKCHNRVLSGKWIWHIGIDKEFIKMNDGQKIREEGRLACQGSS